MKHEPHPMREQFERLLERQGGLYTFDDVLDHISRGLMQSFAKDDTWAVTQVNVFPRRKTVEIAFVIGDRGILAELEQEIIDFARSIGADMITATGRLGWNKTHFPGWEQVSSNFVRKL